MRCARPTSPRPRRAASRSGSRRSRCPPPLRARARGRRRRRRRRTASAADAEATAAEAPRALGHVRRHAGARALLGDARERRRRDRHRRLVVAPTACSRRRARCSSSCGRGDAARRRADQDRPRRRAGRRRAPPRRPSSTTRRRRRSTAATSAGRQRLPARARQLVERLLLQAEAPTCAPTRPRSARRSSSTRGSRAHGVVVDVIARAARGARAARSSRARSTRVRARSAPTARRSTPPAAARGTRAPRAAAAARSRRRSRARARLRGLPKAGDVLFAVADESRPRKVAEMRERRARGRARRRAGVARRRAARAPARAAPRSSTRGGARQRAEGARPRSRATRPRATARRARAVPVVPAVVKVETDGELAAVLELLAALPSHEVRLEPVHAAVGPIGRADVERLAAAAADDACAAQPRVFAFNVGVAGGDVSSAAKRAKVDVRRHSVIYALIDDVRAALCDALPPRVIEEPVGRAEVLQTFAIDGGSTLVAGCRVVDGVLRAKAGVRACGGRGAAGGARGRPRRPRRRRRGRARRAARRRLAPAPQGSRRRGEQGHGVRHRARRLRGL